MRIMRSLMAASAVAMAGLSVSAAQAAPVGGGSPGAAAVMSGERQATVQKAAYRRCWIAGGVRHCRWVADPYDDGYGYGYYDDYYGPGYGYGPGVGFFFGGRGHGFHGHGRGGHGGGHFGGGGHGGGRGGHR
jgi:hypothetical protein